MKLEGVVQPYHTQVHTQKTKTSLVQQHHRHIQSWKTKTSPQPQGGAILQELLTKWNQHGRAVNMTRDMLMYMDRTFVPFNRKTPIKELGLHLWRDNMTRSDKIRPRLIEAVKRQRGGEAELVAGVNEMLTELGAEVMEVPCLFFRDRAGKLHAAGP